MVPPPAAAPQGSRRTRPRTAAPSHTPARPRGRRPPASRFHKDESRGRQAAADRGRRRGGPGAGRRRGLLARAAQPLPRRRRRRRPRPPPRSARRPRRPWRASRSWRRSSRPSRRRRRRPRPRRPRTPRRRSRRRRPRRASRSIPRPLQKAQEEARQEGARGAGEEGGGGAQAPRGGEEGGGGARGRGAARRPRRRRRVAVAAAAAPPPRCRAHADHGAAAAGDPAGHAGEPERPRRDRARGRARAAAARTRRSPCGSGVEGTVELNVLVDERGNVADVQVVTGRGGQGRPQRGRHRQRPQAQVPARHQGRRAREGLGAGPRAVQAAEVEPLPRPARIRHGGTEARRAVFSPTRDSVTPWLIRLTSAPTTRGR